MRRSFDEFSAEVYRRRDSVKEKRKRRTVFLTYFAPIALCCVLSFSVLTVIMPILLGGNSLAPDMGEDTDGVMDSNGKPNGGSSSDDDVGEQEPTYVMEISYITVYSDEGRTVYNNADDIWDVFLYVEDYPDDFKYHSGNPSADGGDYYKVMVCLRDGTTHYYLLDKLGDEEITAGFQALMESLSKR